MAKFSQQISDIRAHLDPRQLIPEVTAIVVEGTNTVKDRVAGRTPVDTGRTKRGWRTAFGKAHATLFNPTNYTTFIFKKGDRSRSPIIGPIVTEEFRKEIPRILLRIDALFQLD